MVGPESPPFPHGASLFADPTRAPLRRYYHRLPQGTQLPPGLGLIADGKDVRTDSPHPENHYTVYPAVQMPMNQFVELAKKLPWQFAGDKK